jgi:hypothetical protein
MTEPTVDRAYDWDDEIENDGAEFTVLPKGRYPFVVVDMDRERHSGSEKLPPCNKAVVHFKFDGGTLGSTTIKENLFLHSKTEGILCAFFASIGQRQHGDKMKMDWGKVVGQTGEADLGIRDYTTDAGEPRQINQVKKYHPAADDAPQTGIGYTKGAF